jgi:hypothetical protein
MSDDYILVPVAIREGETAQLRFPRDITRAEAEKVARVILAYAVDDPAIPLERNEG